MRAETRDQNVFIGVVIASALIGALYGVFVRPYWSEAVEFGQVWAGLVHYEPSNPWFATVVSTPSLQITVPALLLLAGADPWVLSLAASAVFAGLAFAAVSAASYVISRHWALALSVPVMLLTYSFTDSHGYPVAFPITYFQFGQTGQYGAMLALAFAASGWPVVAGVIGGFLAGIHGVWCGAVAVGALPVLWWFQRRSLARFTVAFAAAAIASLLFQIAGDFIMQPKLEYRTSTANSETQALGVNDVHPFVQTPVESNKTSTKQRGTFQGHNVLFAVAPSPVKAALTFFLPDLCFLGLVAILTLGVARSGTKSDVERFRSVYRLLFMVLICVGLAGLFKLYEEVDPEFVLFGMIDQRLPSLILRAVVTRWLNLSTLFLPILTLALPVLVVQRWKSWFVSGSFAVLLILMVFEGQWYLLPDHVDGKPLSLAWFLPLAIIGSVLVSRFFDKGLGGSSTLPARVVKAAITVVLVVKIAVLTTQAADQKLYRGKDARDGLVDMAKHDSGTLIVAPGVIGAYGFNPQIRTGRPIMVPAPLDLRDTTNQRVVHVFCYTDPSTPFSEFYANVRPCFENRSIEDWTLIRKQLRATGLFTPDTWRLRIPVVVSSGGFTYYRIPDEAEGFELARSPLAVGINVQYTHRVSDKPDVCVPNGDSNTLLFRGIVSSADSRGYKVKWQSITVANIPDGTSCTTNPTVWDNTSGTTYSEAWSAAYLGSPGVPPAYFPDLPVEFRKEQLVR